MPASPGSRRPDQVHGAARLSRTSLADLLRTIADAEALEQTIEHHPHLSREDLQGALRGLAAWIDLAPDELFAGIIKYNSVRPAVSDRPSQSALPLGERDEANGEELGAASPAVRRPSNLARLHVWTDGASRGNPGAASVGVVLKTPEGELVGTVSESIGRRTNNFAEYMAVQFALERAVALGARAVLLHSDSELVVRQLQGAYKVKNADLRPIYEAVKALEAELEDGVEYRHVLRELNRDADMLANEALDRE